jgi:hypothetical protein
LLFLGFALAVTASILERQSINRVLGAWDGETADSVGLEMVIGPSTHGMSYSPIVSKVIDETVTPLIPFLIILSAFIAYIPSFPLLNRPRSNTNTLERGVETGTGAIVRDRAEISSLFAHVTDSGKKLSDGRPVFAEVSPGTPRTGVLFGRESMRKKKDIPEIRISCSPDLQSGDTKGDGGEGIDQEPKSGESWRTFGVGEAV